MAFWTWLARTLEANALLCKAVSLVQAWCDDAGLPVPGKDAGTYSRGPERLPIEFLDAANRRINDHLSARIRPEDTSQGDAVKSIDGSSVMLDDTAANQSEYPHPAGQKPGCGLPVMGLKGVAVPLPVRPQREDRSARRRLPPQLQGLAGGQG